MGIFPHQMGNFPHQMGIFPHHHIYEVQERGDKEKVLKLSLYLTLYRYIVKVIPLALLGAAEGPSLPGREAEERTAAPNNRLARTGHGRAMPRR